MTVPIPLPKRLITGALSCLAAIGIGFAASAQGVAPSPWPDTYLGRVEALAVMESLNSALLSSRSATATLEAWCADHHMADPARITAKRVLEADKPISTEQRARLQIGPDEPVRYRHVRLACGDHVLSEADNWYVPGRLTPEMNRLLDTTDTPFGRVIQPLRPERQTLSAERLWSPLPAGWDVGSRPPGAAISSQALAFPPFLFRHRAVIYNDRRRPFAEVVETYTGETLDFDRQGGGASTTVSPLGAVDRRAPGG